MRHGTRYFADISNNQAKVDLATYARAGHRVIALKASEGTGYVDPTYRARVVEAHKHGLAVLHYHFARPDRHPYGQPEARWFAALVRPHLARGDRVVLDIEVQHPRGWRELVAYVHEFEHELSIQTHHKLIGYSGAAFMQAAGAAMQIRARRWWVANYTEKLWLPKWLRSAWAWQRTDGKVGPAPHSCAGIGRCDVSILSRRGYLSIRAELARRR